MRSETAIGPAPGTAAAVRLREGLVQVVVDDVEAHVARARAAHDGVEVRPVVVERRADAVDDLRDLLDVLVEQPERVRVREHQARDVVAGLRAQVVDVDAAALVRADLDDLVAGHRHRRGVGAVGGVGREDLGAVLAAVLVVGAGQQHAGELAVRAGARLEADVREAGDLAERLLELPHQLQRALGALRVLRGVQAGVAGQRGDALVQLRVVLHRARAERVEAGVEVEVALREPVVVADDLRLGDLGELGRLGAAQVARAAGRPGAGRRARAPRTRAGPPWTSRRSSPRGRAASASRTARRGDAWGESPWPGSACRTLSLTVLTRSPPRARPRRRPAGRRRAGRCPRGCAAR